MKEKGSVIALIKPQFEVGKGKVGKGGVVRDSVLHDEVIENLSAFFIGAGLKIEGTVPSPVTGPKGNREFLIYMSYKDQGFSA
jgi:23S rRNA (cytidine1920-2'-O)/16S rRNA (cytidine1409-2'-O)-methyltransferase